MATLEFVRLVPQRVEVHDGALRWVAASGAAIERLPQIVWSNGGTWGEANVWALEIAELKGSETARTAMHHVLAYANWLEREGVDWWHFPPRNSDRCLTRFRGELVRTRDRGELAPSTVSGRMSAIVRFYRWLKAQELISPSWPMWADRLVGIRLVNTFGFEHTLRVITTDLAIPIRRVPGAIELEDGVLPVTVSGMREIVQFAEEQASEELALMLQTGFGSGLRLGSILDLKVATIDQSTHDPVSGWDRLSVGPGARPAVATKFGMSGRVPIPTELLQKLRDYATSARRLKRQTLASAEDRDLLFLTRFGESYASKRSRAVNVEMSRLRQKAKSAGVEVMKGFHFHRTRATFATTLLRVALKCLPVGTAVQLVREACLHKNEATTLKYVKFIEVTEAMAEMADAFTEAFMGLARGPNEA